MPSGLYEESPETVQRGLELDIKTLKEYYHTAGWNFVSIMCHLCPPSQIQYLNHLSHVRIQPYQPFQIPDKMLQWVGSAGYPGIKVRGHALLWSKRGNNPEWVQVGRWGVGSWGSGREALPQELYGEDLVTAMTDRVNFTVNHYHQVLISKSELSEIKKKFC